MSMHLTLATRKSPLALVQARLAEEHLTVAGAAQSTSLFKVVTTGDRQRSWSLEDRGGKGLFTKELEMALLSGEADLAIHSAKDLPTEATPGLEIAGFLPRESVYDTLVCAASAPRPLTTIATGSPRRRSQAKILFREAKWSEIRGNVETRLKKIVSGEADATILAEAGLNRLQLQGYADLVFERFPLDAMVPAAGQGAIALQCRTGESDRFEPCLCRRTGQSVVIERLVLAHLGGGCHTAVGVHHDGSRLHVFHEKTGRVVAPFELKAGEELSAQVEAFFSKHLEGLR